MKISLLKSKLQGKEELIYNHLTKLSELQQVNKYGLLDLDEDLYNRGSKIIERKKKVILQEIERLENDCKNIEIQLLKEEEAV